VRLIGPVPGPSTQSANQQSDPYRAFYVHGILVLTYSWRDDDADSEASLFSSFDKSRVDSSHIITGIRLFESIDVVGVGVYFFPKVLAIRAIRDNRSARGLVSGRTRGQNKYIIQNIE
jgi:hypothetical protein